MGCGCFRLWGVDVFTPDKGVRVFFLDLLRVGFRRVFCFRRFGRAVDVAHEHGFVFPVIFSHVFVSRIELHKLPGPANSKN